MKGTGTTLTRRQRALRYVLLLLLSLAVILYALDFPIPTAELARRATERQHYFGPSEVLCIIEDHPLYSRAYAVRWNNWYGVVSVLKADPFWITGRVYSVPNDPDQLLIPLEDSAHPFPFAPVIVFSNTHSITSVTLEFPVRSEDGEMAMITVIQKEGDHGCFLLSVPSTEVNGRTYSSRFRLSVYDANGELVWRSPTPTGGSEGWDVIFGPDVLEL